VKYEFCLMRAWGNRCCSAPTVTPLHTRHWTAEVSPSQQQPVWSPWWHLPGVSLWTSSSSAKGIERSEFPADFASFILYFFLAVEPWLCLVASPRYHHISNNSRRNNFFFLGGCLERTLARGRAVPPATLASAQRAASVPCNQFLQFQPPCRNNKKLCKTTSRPWKSITVPVTVLFLWLLIYLFSIFFFFAGLIRGCFPVLITSSSRGNVLPSVSLQPPEAAGPRVIGVWTDRNQAPGHDRGDVLPRVLAMGARDQAAERGWRNRGSDPSLASPWWLAPWTRRFRVWERVPRCWTRTTRRDGLAAVTRFQLCCKSFS